MQNGRNPAMTLFLRLAFLLLSAAAFAQTDESRRSRRLDRAKSSSTASLAAKSSASTSIKTALKEC